MYLQYYLEQLGYSEMPEFLVKYLKAPSLLRLKKIGYFCGMDYASKDIYKFREYISRYDHSLTVSLIVYKLTKSKEATLAGLFHDIATPCFAHVIDYMNGDYEKQESTEEYTEAILSKDKYLLSCLKKDNIDISDVTDFKKYTIVDNDRPKVCADRVDGVILTGIGWTKNINLNDIKDIVFAMRIYKNEEDEDEIGFESLEIAKMIVDINRVIDKYCHSDEDNYMMQLLAKITKLAIDNHYILYDDLYRTDEEMLFNLFHKIDDDKIKELIYEFENKKRKDIPKVNLPNVKVRKLNPLVNGMRIK